MAFTDAEVASMRAAVQVQAAPEDLYKLGLVYATGQGGEVDLVQAHMWFNLAALQGLNDAKMSRKEIADQMSSGEVAAALKAAREWLSTRH